MFNMASVPLKIGIGKSILMKPYLDQLTQDNIIEQAQKGLPMEAICHNAGIGVSTFFRFRERHPQFEERWRSARISSSDLLADKLLTIADDVVNTPDAMAAKIKSDNIRSVVAWRNPRVYGPKLNVEHTHTVDLSKALEQANSRAFEAIEQAKQALELSNNQGLTQQTVFKTDSIEVLSSPNKPNDRNTVNQTKPIDVELSDDLEDLL